MAVHQAQVAKINSEGRAVPYAYGAPIRVRGPIRVWASHMRMGLVICPIRVRGKIRVQFITTASQRIFMARDCREWFPAPPD